MKNTVYKIDLYRFVVLNGVVVRPEGLSLCLRVPRDVLPHNIVSRNEAACPLPKARDQSFTQDGNRSSTRTDQPE
jgi:hypothetical protein